MTIPVPRGRQKEVVHLPATGNTVVLGTAGSGKTTMSILRSEAISHPQASNSGPTLLVTFNKTLIRYMEAMAPKEMERVTISTFHSWLRNWIIGNGINFDEALAGSDEKRTLIGLAIRNTAKSRHMPKVLGRPFRFLESEISWIQAQGISSAEEYEQVERTGRGGQTLLRKDRAHVFAVLEEYRRLRSDRGQLFDWDDIATFAQTLPRKPNHYRHFIIDEGQDFTPVMLRAIADAVPDGGSLSWFGDYAQQIYGQRMSWRQAGLPDPKIERFAENYRNTLQIANLALEVAEMPYFTGTPDLVAPNSPRASGPAPLLESFPTPTVEMAEVARLAQERAKTESTAVLFFSRQDERAFEKLLSTSSTSLHKTMTKWVEGPGLWHGTYHSAKGLEFDTVFLPGLSAAVVPSQENIDAYELDNALQSDGKLLYVGVTRARSTLIISHTGQPSSLLPSSLLNR